MFWGRFRCHQPTNSTFYLLQQIAMIILQTELFCFDLWLLLFRTLLLTMYFSV